MTRIQDLFAAFICGAVFVALLWRFIVKRIVIIEVEETGRQEARQDSQSDTRHSPQNIVTFAVASGA